MLLNYILFSNDGAFSGELATNDKAHKTPPNNHTGRFLNCVLIIGWMVPLIFTTKVVAGIVSNNNFKL